MLFLYFSLCRDLQLLDLQYDKSSIPPKRHGSTMIHECNRHWELAVFMHITHMRCVCDLNLETLSDAKIVMAKWVSDTSYSPSGNAPHVYWAPLNYSSSFRISWIFSCLHTKPSAFCLLCCKTQTYDLLRKHVKWVLS